MNKNKNRIKNVIIVNDFDYVQGGASKVAIDTANLLYEKGLNVVFFSGDSKNDQLLNENIKRVSTNQGESLKDKSRLRGIFNGLYNFKSKAKLKKLLSNYNPNDTVVHIHGWTKSLSCSIFKASKKFKTILTLHDYFMACPNGGYFNFKTNDICNLKPLSFKCNKCNCDSRNYAFKIYRLIRQFIQNKIVKINKKIDIAIAISDFSQKILKDNIYYKTKIIRINNPIDFSNIRKSKVPERDYYLYVGRISKEKGVDLFCQAITDLEKKGIVIGDGEQLELLSKKYKNIKFLGWQSIDIVKKYMMNANALIFTSRWYETAGLTVLEALSLKTPVIVSDKTCSKDYVTKSNGLLFETGNVESLKSAINESEKKNFKFDDKFKVEFENETYINKIINAYNL